jgi:hypothetical protein
VSRADAAAGLRPAATCRFGISPPEGEFILPCWQTGRDPLDIGPGSDLESPNPGLSFIPRPMKPLVHRIPSLAEEALAGCSCIT